MLLSVVDPGLRPSGVKKLGFLLRGRLKKRIAVPLVTTFFSTTPVQQVFISSPIFFEGAYLRFIARGTYGLRVRGGCVHKSGHIIYFCLCYDSIASHSIASIAWFKCAVPKSVVWVECTHNSVFCALSTRTNLQPARPY